MSQAQRKDEGLDALIRSLEKADQEVDALTDRVEAKTTAWEAAESGSEAKQDLKTSLDKLERRLDKKEAVREKLQAQIKPAPQGNAGLEGRLEHLELRGRAPSGEPELLLKKTYQLLLSTNDSLRDQGQLLRGQIMAALNVWRSTESDASERSEVPGFRQKVMQYVGIPEGDDKRATGQVSGARGSAVTAAHIFPATANAALLTLVGLEPVDVNSERNGLLLATGVEKAFDRQQVVFALGADHKLRLHVLDGKLADVSYLKYVGWSNKDRKESNYGPKGQPSFSSLEGKQLHFNPATPPYRRLLALHAEISAIKAKVNAWKPVDARSFEKDMLNLEEFRRLSGPTALFPDVKADDGDEKKSEDDNVGGATF